MKKSLLAFFLLVFWTGPVFSADEVLQKIGLSIDTKSPGFKIEMILEKVILSAAASNTRVLIYSADKADLEYTGINDLNGKVLMKAVKKTGYYQIQLFKSDDEKTNVLFDDTVDLYLRNFGDTVYDIAQQVIGNIAKKFPPKPLRELTSINIVRVKLSEYESQDGYWTVGIIPSYNILDVSAGVTALSNGNGLNLDKKLHNNGFSLNVEGTYRIQQWTFILGAGASRGGFGDSGFSGTFNDISFDGTAGYGLFGSLFVVGLNAQMNLCNFMTDYTNYDPSHSNAVLIFPDVNVRSLQLNMYIQVNISKDYYITFTIGPPIPLGFFNSYNLDFNKNGLYPDNSNFTVPANFTFGQPQIKLSLNFRLFSTWWMRVFYEMSGPSFSKSDNNIQHHVPVDSVGLYELDQFNYNRTKIGLGCYYAF